jgi:hypothetical protein
VLPNQAGPSTHPTGGALPAAQWLQHAPPCRMVRHG